MVPIERVDRYYSYVENHLKERGIWEDTLRKFPPNAIRAAVTRILQLLEDFYRDPETLDWGSIFELLRDYERIADFIGALQTQGIVPVDKSELALEEAIRTVEELGKRVVDAKTHDEMVDLAAKYEKATSELQKAKKALKERDEEIKRLQEEAKKKPTIKIRILQNFKEGIQYFKKGDVIETHNIDWALAKIDQKLAERVGVEVPVKVLPEAPPKVVKPEAPADRVRRLTDVFIATLSKNNVPIRPEYRARLRVELPSILTLATLDEQERAVEHFAMEIVNEYKGKVEVARRAREIVPTAPTVKEIPPTWKTTEAGWLLPNGRIIPYGREREEIERVEEVAPPKLKPPAAALWRWLFDAFYSKRWRKVEDGWITEEELFVPDEWDAIRREVERLFGHLPKGEQEELLAQYRAYLPRFKYPDITTFLKEVHKMTMDDFAKLSNEDRKKIWEEFYRSETL
jgi:hypothetical protein